MAWQVDNPWLNLPPAPDFVLPEDAHALENHGMSTDSRHRIHFELLPEPFIGRLDAPIVLLNLNPGFSEYDILFHNSDLGRDLIRRNLAHESMDYPFYLLDPMAREAPGAAWWSKRLREFIEAVGLKIAANSLLCIEYFPYHSMDYDQRLDRVMLPSQEYIRDLVDSALSRDAFIVHLRAKTSRWYRLSHRLETYPRHAFVRNYQQPYFSRGNLPDQFDELVAVATSVR